MQLFMFLLAYAVCKHRDWFYVSSLDLIACLYFCQDFLSNLNPSLSVDDDKIMRWHPKFHLDDVPDVDETDLPQPPVVKTYSSAHDVLEKARDMIAPRVCTCRSSVRKQNEIQVGIFWASEC